MHRKAQKVIATLGVVLAAVVIAALIGAPAAAQERPLRILFMHHSTGQGLIWQGQVRELFTALGYEFWDHGYNDEDLADASGAALGVDWDVPGDNTDPDGWYAIFNQPVTDPPANTFSHMLDYDVILFKSCFPSSNISDEAMFQDYQRYYLSIRAVIDQHPDTLFIPFTTPPLVPNETDAAAAARARRWAEYLTSEQYRGDRANLAVFDFFSLLADANGYLRAEYRGDAWDSHPNALANQTIGPLLVQFVDQAVRAFMPERAPAPVPFPAIDAEPEAPPAQADAAVTGDADLQAAFDLRTPILDRWEYVNDEDSRFLCTVLPDGAGGQPGLSLAFDIVAGSSAGCGFGIRPGAAWAQAAGLSLRVRADQPELWLRVALGAQENEQEDAVPFEFELRVPAEEWLPVVIRWADLIKPEWVGDAGPEQLDLQQVVWIDFDVGYWQAPQAGTIWIADVTLLDE